MKKEWKERRRRKMSKKIIEMRKQTEGEGRDGVEQKDNEMKN